jgi:hypothetical protein
MRRPRLRDPLDLSDLGPLYHDYSFFGARNEQLPGIFAANQRAKAPIVTAYIALAIARARESADGAVSFLELFCADAYYAMVAARLGASPTTGLDNHRDRYSDRAPEIARRLGIRSFRLLDMDVAEIDSLSPVDVVANIGGLYHVANPIEVLESSHRLARGYLVVQSVVSLATEDAEYFETPAPGWDWGSRFSRASFDAMIRARGYDIVQSHANELTGNERLSDRGSVYYLIRK